MALTYGFYNSIEGDRVYDAIQFGMIFDGIIKDGVYATYEKGMMVIASENPSEVIIQPGRAWFNHTWSYNDANIIMAAPNPEVLLERIDTLVLEVNEELSARENSYKWIQGTPSSRPVRPTLTNTSTIHQYPLCDVHRYPETTMIYTRDITNRIGTSDCPFATGVLEGIDLDAWINQWDDEFKTWENTTKSEYDTWENATKAQFEAWMLAQESAFTIWYNAFKDQMAGDVQEVEDFVAYLESVLDASTAVHLQEEIDELKTEITSGSQIRVTTINSELYNRNVTITEPAGTVLTEKFDGSGVANFKSVPYVGNLVISSTYGQQTAERTVNTPYYARYDFAIAFWAATVNIVGDPDFAGQSVTVKDSNETVVGTVVLDSEATGVYTAIQPDTYKFILTYGGETMEVTLSVTQETTYTVTLHAPGFDYEDWLEAGGVTGSYASLDDVLADEAAVRRLCTVHASVDYLAQVEDPGENEDVIKIIKNDIFAKWVNLRDYALDTLSAAPAIKALMDVSHVELVGQVPVMTSNTTPSGVASAISYYSSGGGTFDPYKAYNNSTSTQYLSAQNQSINEFYLRYDFGQIRKVNKAHIVASSYSSSYYYNIKLQGSNDASTWTDISEVLKVQNTESGTTQVGNSYDFIMINDEVNYRYYQIVCTGSNAASMYVSSVAALFVSILQFYAYEYSSKYGYGEWALVGQVPKMTSNTAPYGTSSGSSALQSGSTIYYSYYAFDDNASTTWGKATNDATPYISYIFVNPTTIKKVWIKNYTNGYDSALVKVCARNTGESWVTLKDNVALTTGSGVENTIELDNTTAYDEYAVFALDKGANDYWNVASLQFYAWAPKGNVPVMTANNAPYGTASASSIVQTGYEAYRAFDNYTTSFGWVSNYNVTASAQYLQYKFVNPVRVKKLNVRLTHSSLSASYAVAFNIYGSNDGSTWTDLKRVSLTVAEVIAHTDISLESNNDYYLYYKLGNFSNYVYTAGQGNYVSVCSLQFYGRELSVSVPTMTSDTAPYGVVTPDSTPLSGYDAYRAFDGDNTTSWAHGSSITQNQVMTDRITYQFDHPCVVKKAFAIAVDPTRFYIVAVRIHGSNNGTDWTEIYTDLTQKTAQMPLLDVDNNNEYLYYKFTIAQKNTTTTAAYLPQLYTLQFYGLDYSEREFEEGTNKKWLYDHGVELETLNNVITGGQVLRGTNEITVQGTVNNAYAAIQTDTSIDITPYDVLRMKVTGGVKGGSSAPNFGVNSTKLSADNIVAYSMAFDGNGAIQAPNALGVDVSSVSQTLYVLVVSGLNTGSITLNELWLE